MSRIIGIILAGILLTGCHNTLPAQEVSNAANTTAADPYFFDFGRISNRAPVSHEFLMENKGTQEIHITGKTNSCGCTTSEMSKNTIPPEDSAVVKVTFNPTGYKGVVHQYVYVNTDDPAMAIYRFSIQADVE